MNAPDDTFGAYLPGSDVRLSGAAAGPLQGLRFAAKDAFDVAGHVTGNGNADWAASHPPAETTAAAVSAVLEAGAELVGKTICDEMCFSMVGSNPYYGDPVNPRAPERVTGGSSCGSAAAAAGGLVDFALGTDCGGSVRVPAAFCGILGIRPTHGRISAEGVVALASSFDVVGWFSRDGAIFEKLGRVLLYGEGAAFRPGRLLLPEDMFARVEPRVAVALHEKVALIEAATGLEAEPTLLSEDGTESWYQAFRVLQAGEIWQNHRGWIKQQSPSFGPGVVDRMRFASGVTGGEMAKAQAKRGQAVRRMIELLGEDGLICMPTAGLAPSRQAGAEELQQFRDATMALTCPAGLAGLPQVHIPLTVVEGCPVGLSLMAPWEADEVLLSLAAGVAELAQAA
ncbi:MAG: amidase [Alphaproteobacteria bacterium]|jgi:amidase|nr:amidase [Alphaproteobacteria bacterium]